MRIDNSVLCKHVDADGATVNLLGVLPQLYAGAFPVESIATFMLFAEFDAADCEKPQAVQIGILDADNELTALSEIKMIKSLRMPDGFPSVEGFAIMLPVFFKEPGVYTFVTSVEGEPLHWRRIVVRELPTPA